MPLAWRRDGDRSDRDANSDPTGPRPGAYQRERARGPTSPRHWCVSAPPIELPSEPNGPPPRQPACRLIVVDDGTLLLGAAPAMASAMFNRGLGLDRAAGPARDGARVLRRARRPGRRHARSGRPAGRHRAAPSTRRPRRRARATPSRPTVDGPRHARRGRGRRRRSRDVDARRHRGQRAGSRDRRPVAADGAVHGAHARLDPPASARSRVRPWPPGRCSRRTASVGRAGRRSCPRRAVAGIQRALIDARSRLAAEHGCDLVAAWALAGAHSSANLERAGLARIGQRVVVRAPTSADLDLRADDPATPQQVDLASLHDPGSSAGSSWRAPDPVAAAGSGRSDGRRPRRARHLPGATGGTGVRPSSGSGTSCRRRRSTPISSAVSRAGSTARAARSSAGPLRARRIVLDEERRTGRARGSAPRPAARSRRDHPVAAARLPGRDRAPSRSNGAGERRRRCRRWRSAQVARPVPASDPRTSSAGRPTHDCGGELRVEHADQLKVRVAEPDQPVVASPDGRAARPRPASTRGPPTAPRPPHPGRRTAITRWSMPVSIARA